eukprot:359319-Chlamydomonas_euryale.AAC.2
MGLHLTHPGVAPSCHPDPDLTDHYSDHVLVVMQLVGRFGRRKAAPRAPRPDWDALYDPSGAKAAAFEQAVMRRRTRWT